MSLAARELEHRPISKPEINNFTFATIGFDVVKQIIKTGNSFVLMSRFSALEDNESNVGMENNDMADPGAGDIMAEKTSFDSQSGNLPDLVSFEQKPAADKPKLSEQIVTNGKADEEGHKKDDGSPSQMENSKNDERSHEVAADSVKESDVEDEWMDLLGSGQLKKKVLVAGKEKTRPPQGSVVTVKTRMNLKSGACVGDSTETFILGDGDVIAALDMCVALMDIQETAEVVTAARFAYGAKGREPDIPGDASLTLTVQLLDVQSPVELLKQSAEERLKFGEKKRERGNELFGREDYSGAINSYSKAVKFLDSSRGSSLQGDTSVLQNMLESKVKCYNNMAASQLKVGATDAAIRSCEEVLKAQPNNIKAIYRLGKAYGSKGEATKAIMLLKKAIKLDPESKLLHRELAALTQKQKKQSESEKTMYKRMMGTLADAAQTKKPDRSSNNLMKWSVVAGALLVTAASMGLAYYRASH